VIFDDTICSLGEGPLWHPLRGTLFWFDILDSRLFERGEAMETAQMWQFDEHVSAAGWVDKETLLIASETALFLFNLGTGNRTNLKQLEADNPNTRSNDGRADPWGGFWIGTMGKQAEAGAGAIYRFYQGKLTQLFQDITISNSICFSPDKTVAYFTDTPTQKIMKVKLDQDGWPDGVPELFVDVAPYNPDGSVVDAKGNLWNAQWGASRVACYDTVGAMIAVQEFETSQISCPAFGGENLSTLFATSASVDLPADHLATAGMTHRAVINSQGQSEHQVRLG
jgi:sugar lactone lactonase YvrE